MTHPPSPVVPSRMELRPGLHVARRDDRHLQVGVDPPWRLVVPDEPDVRRLLRDLRAGGRPAPETPVGHRVLQALAEADLLVDPADVAAVAAARAGVRVWVEAPGPAGTDAVRGLRAAGVAVAGSGAEADVALLLADGEIPRDLVDAQVRADRPHLVVTASPAGHRLGPFVVPGSTACLRCVDAHLGERDPRRALVLEQVTGRPAGPGDPALAALATAWAVRDVLTWIDGSQPSTWSATTDLGADLLPQRREWPRHPHCGCSWAGHMAVG